MKNSKYIISSGMSVKEAIAYMEDNDIKGTVVADDENKLLGLFTLGDMRHFFLNNGKLTDSVINAMNKKPIVFHSLFDAEQAAQRLVIYPIVDSNNKIIDILDKNQLFDTVESSDVLKDVPVVIMAGGKGTRLYPYTKILPKPLIPIGEYTISERIINSFRKYGCKDFFMILNYKAGMIKSYYSELEKDYNLDFAQEEKFLGTGGGLWYLRDKIDRTFFFSNCDILINADLECIYKTHKKQGNTITFVCAMKDVVIPYGVVETNKQGEIVAMKEKPEFSFLTNTGLYVVEPEVVQGLTKDEFIHMPDIAQQYLDRGEKVGVFPISEKAWMDMGQFSEMESMMKELGVEL